jgi:hypothetical protein
VADKNFKVKSGLNIPITSAAILTTDANGNISSTATLPIANGGTGQTSANNALNALLPIQDGGTVNYSLQSGGTNVSWVKLYNQTIKNAGTSVNPRGIINFVGATLTDDSGSDTTTITFTDAVGVSKSGGDTITASSASVIPVIVKGAASQTANLQEWQNSAGGVLLNIDSTGNLDIGAGSSNLWRIKNQGVAVIEWQPNQGFMFLPYGSSNKPVTIRGAASQTGNLTEWQNSAGTVLSRVSSSGVIYASSGIVVDTIWGSANSVAKSLWGDSTTGSITIGVNLTTGLLNLGTSGQQTGAINIGNGSGTNNRTINIGNGASAGTTSIVIGSSSGATSNITLNGNVTFNGTTTNINTTNLVIEDKNIIIADVDSPTDTTADGAGITIKGATDKTFNWVQSTASFTSSQPISAPAFKSAGTAVSSNITLVSGYKYFVDTASARTLTLPASPSLGDEIQIFDATGTAFTNNVTLSRNGNKINGISDDGIIDINGASATLTYTGSTYGWRFE